MENKRENSALRSYGQKVLSRFKEFRVSSTMDKIKASVISALGGILVGLIIMMLINFQGVIDFIITLASGKFKFDPNTYIIGSIVQSAPILIAGLSVAFAFRTGLFNIGASGQILVGGITAIYIGHLISLPGPLHFLVALIGAIIAGSIWGGITGTLKAYFNINEVVTSIMLNYVAAHLVKFLSRQKLVFDLFRSQTKMLPKSATIPTLGLDRLFPHSGFDISIFIVILTAILVFIILEKTTLGYQLKAVGYNPLGAKTNGIKYRRNIILSMLIAGALSGLAGGIIYLSGANATQIRVQINIPGEGFDGISVALLATNSPIGVIFSAIFINFITQFGSLVEGASTFKKEISDVIIAVIIYFSALSSITLYYLNVRKRKRLKHNSELNKEGDE